MRDYQKISAPGDDREDAAICLRPGLKTLVKLPQPRFAIVGASADDAPGMAAALSASEVDLRLPLDTLGALSGLKWLLPSTGDNPPFWVYCGTPADQVLTLAGTPLAVYSVTLRIRGVFEVTTYTGGVAGSNPLLNIDGANSDGASNIYSLIVSSPAHTYNLNAGSQFTPIIAYDYTFTLLMTAGATLTLRADPQNSGELKNATPAQVVVGGGDPALGVTQPYNGQFMQMDVVSIVEV